MAKAERYIQLGEEAARGAAEVTTFAALPVLNTSLPLSEFQDDPKKEFRGGETRRGDQEVNRKFESWSGSYEIPLFSELKDAVGAPFIGKLFKHLLGKVTTGTVVDTTAYPHMFYDNIDPFDTGSIGAKALTFNENMSEGSTVIHSPYVGGRLKSASFVQEMPEQLQLNIETFGQFLDTKGAALALPVDAYPVEALSFRYNDLQFYRGAPSYTGVAPDFTDIDPTAGDLIKVDSLTINIANGFEDVKRSAGLTYSEHTRVNGMFEVELEFTVDWSDPASGFSSVDDLNAWLAASSEEHFTALWDTGVLAGASTANHKLIIDMPRMQRMGGEVAFEKEADPLVTLKYKALFDATTAKYLVGILLQNTASAI